MMCYKSSTQIFLFFLFEQLVTRRQQLLLNSTYAAAENISTRLPGLISVLTVKSLSAASSFLLTAFFLLRLDKTDTRDKTGAVVSESLAVRKGNTKIFVLNFYNTSSKVLLNGNQLYIIDFITSSLSDILGILDRNEPVLGSVYSPMYHCLVFDQYFGLFQST
jgi:hypothetical protein